MRAGGGIVRGALVAHVEQSTGPRMSLVSSIEVIPTHGHHARAALLIAALGGARNLVEVEACALTRVRVVLRDPDALDEPALDRAGVAGVWRFGEGLVHLIVGEDAPGIAAALSQLVTPLRTTSRGPS